ncbi:MAG: transposase [Candidatus Marsarchaeota archaeon]|nr:transposase [Candidatus Marsarchaeota archaeon]
MTEITFPKVGEKHKTGRDHDWVKVHICSGVSMRIITSVGVLPENSGDSPQSIPLAEKTHNAGFTIDEMSADKAYGSRDTDVYVDQISGTPYIAFRSDATGKPRGSSHIWRKM